MVSENLSDELNLVEKREKRIDDAITLFIEYQKKRYSSLNVDLEGMEKASKLKSEKNNRFEPSVFSKPITNFFKSNDLFADDDQATKFESGLNDMLKDHEMIKWLNHPLVSVLVNIATPFIMSKTQEFLSKNKPPKSEKA